MKDPILAAALLLLTSASALAAPPAIAELTYDGVVITGSVDVPINFGNKDLGEIATAGLSVCFRKTTSPAGACDAPGTVQRLSNLASPFSVPGQFREVIATGAKTPVNYPVNLQAGRRLLIQTMWVSNQIGPASDTLVLRGTPTGGVADELRFNHSGMGVAPGPCSPTDSLCLNNDRFKVRSHFLTSAAQTGSAGVFKLTDDTGYLYFFNPSNVEAVVKVLNACSLNNRYWVFAGGLTDVRTVITVTDTQRNAVRTYINPQGTAFQPIQDTAAFATCP